MGKSARGQVPGHAGVARGYVGKVLRTSKSLRTAADFLSQRIYDLRNWIRITLERD